MRFSFGFCNNKQFISCFIGDEESQPRKRAKSIADQRKLLKNSCPDLIADYDSKIQVLLAVQKSHLKVNHELRVEREH
jgi:hypothetical protein